jgi:FHA domain-containing protein
MSVLRAIETRIEGLFEGIFGRAFRTHVQPIELARKLVKEMDDHRNVSVSRVYVPNEYTIYLSPEDRKQFAGYEGSLVGELQEYLSEHARREQYALLAPPRVVITVDGDLAVGEFGIATRLVAAEDEKPPAELPLDQPAQTMIYKAPAPPVPVPAVAPEPEPEPVRRSFTLTVAGKPHELSTARAVLGRSRDCDVRVSDLNVSRRHAEVREDGDAYVLVDLGSTNGTLLNGQRVDRERLEDGDTITLGSTEIVFSQSSSTP